MIGTIRNCRWKDFGIDKVKGLGDGDFLEDTNFSRFQTPKKLKLASWPKEWVVIPSLSMMKGYNRHMKGFPKMTLSIIFLMRTNVVLKHVLS